MHATVGVVDASNAYVRVYVDEARARRGGRLFSVWWKHEARLTAHPTHSLPLPPNSFLILTISHSEFTLSRFSLFFFTSFKMKLSSVNCHLHSMLFKWNDFWCRANEVACRCDLCAAWRAPHRLSSVRRKMIEWLTVRWSEQRQISHYKWMNLITAKHTISVLFFSAH